MGEANWPLTGFSPRKQSMTVYVMKGFENYQSYLEILGKVKHSKSCLYINKLADIDLDVFKAFMKDAIADMRLSYPT